MKHKATIDKPKNSGEITRRTFLEKTTATGVALGVAPGFLTAAAQAATPKPGGHLKLALGEGAVSETIDPTLNVNEFVATVNATRLNTLTEVGSDGNLKPELAESWEAINGTSEWLFRIRDGVEFHNGKPLTADDVIATLNLHRGDNSSSVVNSLAKQIQEMSIDGDRNIRLKLASENADFPFILSDVAFSILPSENGKIDPTTHVGTGGYIIENYEPGVRMDLTRNANYFKDDAAYFESAEVLAMHDAAARQNALVAAAVDVINKVEPKLAARMSKQNGVTIVDVPGTHHYNFPMRTDTGPFDDNDVRLALKYAVNRQEILDKVLFGHGTVGNDHPISPANRYFATDLAQRDYDPDKARFHLKQAGMDGLTVQLSASDGIWAGAVDACQLYQQHALKAGINIEINRVPNDGYWSEVWMQHPWCTAYWGGRATEDWMFSAGYSSSSNWNDTFWKNEQFDKLLLDARGEQDEARRREMYAEMQQIVSDDGGAMIPLFANHIMAHRDTVSHGPSVGGNYDVDGRKLIERWWKA